MDNKMTADQAFDSKTNDPVCGNCFKKKSEHYFEDGIYCYTETTGDIFTDEPAEHVVLTMLADKRPELYDLCVAEWRYKNGHSAVPPQALSAPRVPDGWKLVPVEPTKAMLYSAESPIDEIISCRQSSQHAIAKAAYAAMLAASPEPVAPELRFAGDHLLRRALQSLRLGDTADADKCIETVLAEPEFAKAEPVARTFERDSGTLTVDADGGVQKIEPKRYEETAHGKVTGMSVGRISNEHHYACREIVAERDDLRAEVEALRVDAERLDWLDKNVTMVSDSERYLPRRVYWGGGTNKNVRQAIDAARLRDGGSDEN